MLKSWKGITPNVAPGAFIEDSAQVIGDVTVGREASVWFNCTIRGDVNYIKIGDRTNIQDGSVLHVNRTPSHPLVIGDDVTVAHSVTLHGCVIEGPALIGMGAIVMDGAVIGPNVIVAAGALVVEGTNIPPRTLVMGSPARSKRELKENEIAWLKVLANSYVKYRLDYMDDDGGLNR